MTENIKQGQAESNKVLPEVIVTGTGNYKPGRKRDYNKFVKFGTSDKLASIYGELQTAENANTNSSENTQSLISRFTGEHAPGDSVVIDMDYNFNVPNWGINDFLNERSMFQKGISTLAGEPGHFYFKIFFNFDTSFGLLGSLLHVDNNSFSQFSTNTAIKYLMYSSIGRPHRSDDIPGRMLALFKFGNLLSYISNYSPWFFKSIKNLSSADVYPLTEIQNDKNTIEIELNPDAVDMRVTTLFDLYRYACYDRIKMLESLIWM